MDKNIYNNIIQKDLLERGYFSEYLPPEFNLTGIKLNLIRKKLIKEKNYHVDPITFTMNRLNNNDDRRIIHIPELNSFLLALEILYTTPLLRKIFEINKNNDNSFSKLLTTKNQIIHFEKHSDNFSLAQINEIQSHEKQTDNFAENILIKIKKAKGAVGILKLDISNFFESFYTHYISSIDKGYNWAQKNFVNKQQNKDTDKEYNILKSIDEKITGMNKGRTHGLLVGPTISRILAEGLLCTIDKELVDQNIKYIRFMDDYEIFIYNENEIDKIKNNVITVLGKYGFRLNNGKTKYEPFPYYQLINYNKLINNNIKDINDNQLIEVFNKFADIESSDIQKGALKYLIGSNIFNSANLDVDLSVSLILNALRNNPKSAILGCHKLILLYENVKFKVDDDFKDILIKFLVYCIENNYDLELIWLTYLIKKLKIKLNKKFINKIIETGNELAIILMYHEFKSDININKLKKREYSWMFLFELYREDIITEEDFYGKTKLENYKDFYNYLKSINFNFYKKS